MALTCIVLEMKGKFSHGPTKASGEGRKRSQKAQPSFCLWLVSPGAPAASLPVGWGLNRGLV